MHYVLWAQAHWGQALALLAAAATILGTVRNVLTQIGAISPDAGAKLGRVADRLSWVAEHGKTGIAGGWLSLPGLASQPKGLALPPGPPAGALLPLMLIPLLSSCATPYGKAYKACLKTEAAAALPAAAQKIPQQVEAVMATAAAAGPVAAALEALVYAGTDGEFLVACAVKAWQATHPLPSVPSGGAVPDAAAPSTLKAAHDGANLFLMAHPAAAAKATSCAERAGG